MKIKRLGVAEASEVFFKGAASTIERDAFFCLFFFEMIKFHYYHNYDLIFVKFTLLNVCFK